eukprot:9190744-Pyramimonas_sp.AAC.1
MRRAPHRQQVPRDRVVELLEVGERAPEAHAHGVRQLLVDGPGVGLLETRLALDGRAPGGRVAPRP